MKLINQNMFKTHEFRQRGNQFPVEMELGYTKKALERGNKLEFIRTFLEL